MVISQNRNEFYGLNHWPEQDFNVKKIVTQNSHNRNLPELN